MSPRWLHWPAAAGISANYVLEGDLVFSTSSRFNITNTSESGLTPTDFSVYASQPIRDEGTSIKFIIRIDGWASIDDFVASGGFSDVKFIVNGLEYSESSVTYNSGAGTLLQFNMNEASSSGDAAAFWATMSDGDPFRLELYY
jgi:hypothetical protein